MPTAMAAEDASASNDSQSPRHHVSCNGSQLHSLHFALSKVAATTTACRMCSRVPLLAPIASLVDVYRCLMMLPAVLRLVFTISGDNVALEPL